MIEWIRAHDCGVAVDLTRHPVVITTWIGTPTIELIDRYYAWFDTLAAASLAAEQRLVRVNDLTQARCPPGAVCKRVYEHVRNDLAAEVTLANYVAIEDPLIHRVVAALRWVSGGRRDPNLHVVESMTGALEAAIERLGVERIPLPRGLDPAVYQAPRLGSMLM